MCESVCFEITLINYNCLNLWPRQPVLYEAAMVHLSWSDSEVAVSDGYVSANHCWCTAEEVSAGNHVLFPLNHQEDSGCWERPRQSCYCVCVFVICLSQSLVLDKCGLSFVIYCNASHLTFQQISCRTLKAKSVFCVYFAVKTNCWSNADCIRVTEVVVLLPLHSSLEYLVLIGQSQHSTVKYLYIMTVKWHNCITALD